EARSSSDSCSRVMEAGQWSTLCTSTVVEKWSVCPQCVSVQAALLWLHSDSRPEASLHHLAQRTSTSAVVGALGGGGGSERDVSARAAWLCQLLLSVALSRTALFRGAACGEQLLSPNKTLIQRADSRAQTEEEVRDRKLECVNPPVFGGRGFCGLDGSVSAALAWIQLTVTETVQEAKGVFNACEKGLLTYA
ncbi:Filamentous hemagglutinin transporter protein FhaC, partial [Dissostichus eleginoides]